MSGERGPARASGGGRPPFSLSGGRPRRAFRSSFSRVAAARSSRSVRGSEWRVVLDAPGHILNLLDQIVKVSLAVDEVDLRGIDDEQRAGGVVVEEVVVGLIELFHVPLCDLRLVVPLPP